MKLICKGRYRNAARQLYFEPSTIEVDENVGEFLLRDAPDNFEIPAETVTAEPVTTAFDEPSQDKMIKTPRRKK